MEGLSEVQQRAAALLWAVWKGTPNSYKSRYRRTIWRQFEDNVRSAAYTDNLGKFVDSLCLALNAEFRGGDVELVNNTLRKGGDKALLKLVREETTLLILVVRLWNQERRGEWETRAAAREAEEEAMAQPGFGLPEEEAE